jgi:predicted phage terminase large subunit-like protein
VLVGLEQDPASAGEFEMAEYMTYLDGFAVKAFPARVDKITRCKPASTQAEAGNMRIVKGAWNAAFLSETEDFPDGLHDDIVDALSGAHNSISATGFRAPKQPPVEPRASIFGDTDTPGW